MEANGFNKSGSTASVLAKETAEAISTAFHPDRITFFPAAPLKCVYENWAKSGPYYLIMVSLYIMTVYM